MLRVAPLVVMLRVSGDAARLCAQGCVRRVKNNSLWPGGLGTWLICWSVACAPVGSLRPNLPPTEDQELVAGLSVTRAKPIPGMEAYDLHLRSVGRGNTASGQIGFRTTGGTEVSLVAFGGSLNGAGIGVVGRWERLARPDRRVSLEVGLGAVWAYVAVPCAFAIAGDFWLTLAPAFNFAVFAPVRLPFGVAYALGRHIVFSEITMAANPFDRSFDGNMPLSVAGTLGWAVRY